MTSTNGDLKGFIDQNQSPTKGKRILPAYVVEKHTLRFISLLCLLNEFFTAQYVLFWDAQNLVSQNVLSAATLVDMMCYKHRVPLMSNFTEGE